MGFVISLWHSLDLPYNQWREASARFVMVDQDVLVCTATDWKQLDLLDLCTNHLYPSPPPTHTHTHLRGYAGQPLKVARGLKFCIKEVEVLYYPSSEADPRLVFAYAKRWFSHEAAKW